MKIMPVVKVGVVGRCQSSPASYGSSMGSYRTPTSKAIAAHALSELEKARKADIAQHEANLPAIENNKAVRDAVEQLMDGIGMPKKFSERDTKSRARFPKTITNPAGYIGDLNRECPISDGFESATMTYNSLLARYEAYATQAEGEEERRVAEQKREENARINKRKADMTLATILLRYELPIESDWDDVLEALRERDQRLDLAVAMQQTRGDWSEGPYRVRDAMARFSIRTDEDKNIANDVLGCMDDFEDGRVFRDTTWSYDRLFASVEDQQLVADVQMAASNVRDL